MTNRFDETILHAAVLANNPGAIQLCLEHSYWSERRGKLLRQLDYRGNSPLALALVLGYGHCIFEILKHDAHCCTLPDARNEKFVFSHSSDWIQEDESWSLTPKFNRSQLEEAALLEIEIDSSFVTALKNHRFRALDLIFTKH